MSLRAVLGRGDVAAGAARAFLARVAGAGLAFGVGVAVARMLGPEGAGVYFLAVTLATIAGVGGRLGLDQLCVRRIAAARERGDPARALRTARDGRRLAGLASLGVAALLFVAAPLFRHVFDVEGIAGALRIVALGVAPLSVVILSGECLRGLGHPGASQLVATALAPACTLALIALGTAVLGARTDVLLAAWAGGAFLAAGLAVLAWRRVAPPTAPAAPGAGGANRLAREAVPFLGVAALSLALPWISILALALRGDEAEIGIFSLAYRTATLTSFVLIAVNAAVGPRFAALAARGDRAGLARSARLAALGTGLCALPLVALAWILPGRIMALFGPEFADGGRVLAILASGQLVNVLTGSVGVLLMMSGNERALRANLILAVLASLVLHAWLVPSRGVEGAAIASAISLAGLNLASLVAVRRRLAIDVLPLPFLRARGGLHG